MAGLSGLSRMNRTVRCLGRSDGAAVKYGASGDDGTLYFAAQRLTEPRRIAGTAELAACIKYPLLLRIEDADVGIGTSLKSAFGQLTDLGSLAGHEIDEIT